MSWWSGGTVIGGCWRTTCVLGVLRWRPRDEGRRHAITGVAIRLPAHGVLRVERLVVSGGGTVVDVGGTVHPIRP